VFNSPVIRRLLLACAALLATVGSVLVVSDERPAAVELAAVGRAAGRAERPVEVQPPDPAPVTQATIAVAQLPEPVPPPTADYMDEPIVEIGRLAIPAIGLDQPLYQGVSLTNIDHGPSHWPGTAMPGHRGNVVVAGHRVTRTRPFRHLDRLQPGDQAVFTTADGESVYEFVGTEVVTPDRVDIVDQTPDFTATFYACHPPGSARYRIVARWRLVSAPFGA
jgi:sortase A